jgi:GNAT superfamily N-acetyltransferase
MNMANLIAPLSTRPGCDLYLKETTNNSGNQLARQALCLVNLLTLGQRITDRDARMYLASERPFPSRIVVGLVDSVLVSSAYFQSDSLVADQPAILCGLAVDRRHQSRGFGAATLLFVEEIARELASRIELDSSPAAIGFYLRCGYHQKSPRVAFELTKDL